MQRSTAFAGMILLFADYTYAQNPKQDLTFESSGCGRQRFSRWLARRRLGWFHDLPWKFRRNRCGVSTTNIGYCPCIRTSQRHPIFKFVMLIAVNLNLSLVAATWTANWKQARFDRFEFELLRTFWANRLGHVPLSLMVILILIKAASAMFFH